MSGATGVSAEHTSVPRWPADPPDVDYLARELLVLSAGVHGRRVADRWLEQSRALRRPVLSRHGDDWAPWLAARLERAHVGVRVMAAGPELFVLDVLRAARAAGMVVAELRAHVTERELRRVYCPHCTAMVEACVGLGEVVACSGCACKLVVYHHLARAHGAYLGYMVDAEEQVA